MSNSFFSLAGSDSPVLLRPPLQWVEEKTGGRIQAAHVASVSIDTIRRGGPEAVCAQLCGLPKVQCGSKCTILNGDSPSLPPSFMDCSFSSLQGTVCILNTASEGDMAVLAAGILKVKQMRSKHEEFVQFIVPFSNTFR